MKHLKTLLVGAGVLVASTGLASAATTPPVNMPISLVIGSSCSVTAAAMTFPATFSLTTAVSSPAAIVAVTCSSGTSYTMTIGPGANRIPNGNRQLKRDGALDTDTKIPYTLTRVTGGNDEYPVGTPTPTLTGTGAAQNYNIFGFIPVMATTPAVGTYRDTVAITVDY